MGHERWLIGELPRLVEEGLLDADQAERLRRRYAPTEPRDPLARVLLVTAGLAALLIGAGIILIVAHNWEDIPRLGRTALGFALLLGAQGLAGFALVRRAASDAWRESTALFVVLTLGACMAIVAQAWQIAWTPQGFLLSWILLGLPLVYVMRARVLMPLAWFGAFSWGVSAFDAWQGATGLIGFLALALALFPAHAAARRLGGATTRTAFAEWSAALALALAVPALWPGALGWMKLPVAGAALALLHALGERVDADRPTRWQRAFATVGGIGLFVVVFFGSFADSWTRPGEILRPASTGEWALASLGALALALTLALVLSGALRREAPHIAALHALPLVLVAGDVAARQSGPGTAALLLNGAGAVAGALILHSGLRNQRLLRANAGLALIGALVLARFFDTEWSFVWRGSVFIALGVAILALNIWIVRAGRRRTNS